MDEVYILTEPESKKDKNHLSLTLKINIHQPIPVRIRDLLHRRIARIDAGTVQDAVDAAGMLDDVGDKLGALGRVGDVERRRRRQIAGEIMAGLRCGLHAGGVDVA